MFRDRSGLLFWRTARAIALGYNNFGFEAIFFEIVLKINMIKVGVIKKRMDLKLFTALPRSSHKDENNTFAARWA